MNGIQRRGGIKTASNSIPDPLWTGVLAFLLTVLTGGIWTGLLITNLRRTPSIPWAPFIMGLLLWVMWSFLGGKGPRETTKTARRRFLRANRVSSRIFAFSLVAGALSIASLTGIWIVMFRVVRTPGNALPDFSSYPATTVVLVIAMASLVSSLVEEAGFRGYFQVALESRFNGPIAICIQALLIAPAHGLTQGFVWSTVLFYFLVDAMLGTSAYLTNSIVPGVLIHSFGLLIFFELVWPHDRERASVWETGADMWFWIHVAQAIIFGGLAAAAFARLAKAIRRGSKEHSYINSSAAGGSFR